MNLADLELPARTVKPRRTGITAVIDNGLPTELFVDAISSYGDLVDVVKFGWGTALVTGDLDRKIAALRRHDVRFCFGGTLFEKFVSQHRFEAFVDLCRRTRVDLVEVSNGTITLPNSAKAAYIRACAEEFVVVSEVGFKDAERSGRLSPSMWVEAIREDLAAGAQLVITEARESGRSGICRADGELRFGLIEDILASGIDPDLLLFEAPTKELQAWFVDRIGANVNLANIAPIDVIGLETLRLGLRSDTLLSDRLSWETAVPVAVGAAGA